MIMGSGLSMDQAPPVRVPYRFFATAPLFGVLAGILLLHFGGTLLSTRFSNHLYGMVHLLTLGFITMAMQGALFQMLPVLAGTPFRGAVRNSFWIYLLYLPGVLFFTAGFLLDRELLLAPGILFLLTSLVSFIVLFFRTIGTTRVENDSVRAMRHAVFSLGILLLLGSLLGLTHLASFDLPLHPFLTGLHMGWALGGWVGVLIMGVSFQVLPMFYVTPEYPRWMRRWLSTIVLALLFFWSLLALLGGSIAPFALWVDRFSIVLTIPFLVFAIATLVALHRRLRKIFEINVLFFRTGMAFLLLSILCYAVSLMIEPSLFRERLVVVTGIFYIYGFVVSVINGMLYRIVPFLAWFHLMGRGVSDAPNMREILPPRLPTIQLVLHGVAITLLVIASVSGVPLMAILAGAMVGTSFLLLWINLVRVVRLYQRYASKGSSGSDNTASGMSGQAP